MISWVARSEVLTKNARGIMRSSGESSVTQWCDVPRECWWWRRWRSHADERWCCALCHADKRGRHWSRVLATSRVDKRRDWHQRRPIGTRRQLARLKVRARLAFISPPSTDHTRVVSHRLHMRVTQSHLLRFSPRWDALSHCSWLSTVFCISTYYVIKFIWIQLYNNHFK